MMHSMYNVQSLLYKVIAFLHKASMERQNILGFIKNIFED